MLKVKSVNHGFEKPILKTIQFELKKGEIVSVIGKSGAGKTTFLRILAGLLTPEKGEVLFNDEVLKGPQVKLIPGHDEIGLVNQDFKLDDFHSVEENIRLQILNLNRDKRDRFVDELLELTGLLEIRKQQAKTLSGGEQQRLAIARVLAKEPQVILLDEPFSHMDSILRSKLVNYLLELRRIRKTSIILVSHDGTEVLGLSDSIYMLKNGQLIKKGSPIQVYFKPKTQEEAKIFGPINSVKINNKRILFRPNEYSLEEINEKEGLKVQFLNSIFVGSFFENYFLTEKKEKIVLFDFKILKDVTKIFISKYEA